MKAVGRSDGPWGSGRRSLPWLCLAWFVVKPRLTDDDGGEAVGSTQTTAAAQDAATEATSASTGGTAVDGAAGGSTTTASGGATTTTTASGGATTTTTALGGATTTTAGAASLDATTTTSRATTTAATAATTTVPAAPYETLPDGSPAPVIATFDTNSIRLTGAVPDQAAKDRLEVLAVANSKPGQADLVDNQLVLNPAVPRNVGVRVVELTSARFPDGSTEVLPPHGAELDRIVTIMNALPNTSALIIGHADQRGDSLTNYSLSEQRALAVKNYVASHGIALERLSSRAVGESDLLTLNDDAAALALNRRTEIVFYGLLLG